MPFDSFAKSFYHKTINLTGEFVELIPYSSEYISDYDEWMENDQLAYAMNLTYDGMDGECTRYRNFFSDPDVMALMITEKNEREDNNPVVGALNIYLTKGQTEAEFYFIVAKRAYRSRGYAQEALRLVMRFCFVALDVSVMRTSINCNDRSRAHILIKHGFGLKAREGNKYVFERENHPQLIPTLLIPPRRDRQPFGIYEE